MTRETYMDALRRIEGQNPKEPLLATLRGGFTRLNVIYMKAAMARLTVPAALVAVAATDAPAIEEVNTEGVLKMLYKQQQVLRGEKAKLSNKFHNCTTNEQRREVSKQIVGKDAVIRANEGKIAHYKAHNVLPTDDESDEFYLPDDPIALMRKRASIAAQISQTKKTLDGLGALSESDPARGKIGEYEAKLDRLKIYKGYAEQKIKAATT